MTYYYSRMRLNEMRGTSFVAMFLLTCVLSGKGEQNQQISHASGACIEILKSTPLITLTDDSGNTIEPKHLFIKAYGRPEDLTSGEVVFLEDDQEVKVIPVGDLKPGLQTLTIPAGLHERTTSGSFSYSVIRPDGTATPGSTISISMNSIGYVPPAKHSRTRKKLKRDRYSADPDFEIGTIEPGVDPNEAMAIAAFQPNEVGLTSTEGEISYTEGDGDPPQMLTIRGANLKDGILVRFWAQRGGERIEATASLTRTRSIATLRFPEAPRSDMPTILYESTVVVPASITHRVRGAFSVRSSHGDTRARCK